MLGSIYKIFFISSNELFQNLIGMLGRKAQAVSESWDVAVSKPYRYARKNQRPP